MYKISADCPSCVGEKKTFINVRSNWDEIKRNRSISGRQTNTHTHIAWKKYFVNFFLRYVSPSDRLLLNFVLLIVSCVFSLITLLVYACLPSLRNLHGKTLMCYVSSLLSAYICLAITYQINANDAPITCKVVGRLVRYAFIYPRSSEKNCVRTASGTMFLLFSFSAYTMLFSFLSAFSWLNVMCFDIWWTFGWVRIESNGVMCNWGNWTQIGKSIIVPLRQPIAWVP